MQANASLTTYDLLLPPGIISKWYILRWHLGGWGNRDTKFCVNGSNKMLLNAAKCQGYSFYHFWVINGKPTGGDGGGKITLPRLVWIGKSNSI